jgi:hypothetical protein
MVQTRKKTYYVPVVAAKAMASNASNVLAEVDYVEVELTVNNDDSSLSKVELAVNNDDSSESIEVELAVNNDDSSERSEVEIAVNNNDSSESSEISRERFLDFHVHITK